MRKVISIVLISIFCINMIFISNSLASTNSLSEVLYPNGGRKAWYFYKQNDPSGKALVDVINEEYLETKGDDKHACAVKHQATFLGKSLDDLYYRYNWLHAAYDMVEYVKGKDYKDLSKIESGEDIANAITALKYTRGALGSFNLSNQSLPDVGHWWNDDMAWAEFGRSKEAFKDIVGHYYTTPSEDKLTDEFEKDICNCIKNLKASYDYGNKTTEYASGVNIWDDFDKKYAYSSEQITQYLESYGKRCNVDESKDKTLLLQWEETLGKSPDELLEEFDGKSSTGEVDEKEAIKHEKTVKIDPDKDTVYSQPKRVSKEKGKAATDDVVNDADNFINDPNSASYIKTEELQDFSQNIYSILVGIGIVIAVIIGAIIGVKLMFAPLEERAEAKKLLIPYVVGCVLVFGAFGIWKLIITILQDI